jgi:hypothetical protein
VALTVAGNTVTLTQRFTAQVFSDVDLGPDSPYFNGANLLRTNNITAGCQTTPLLYCPDQNVTRGQIAIFIVRTMLGGGATVDNFNYSTTPYFTDVPITHQYFKWIQKLRDLGVTGDARRRLIARTPTYRATRWRFSLFAHAWARRRPSPITRRRTSRTNRRLTPLTTSTFRS